MTALPAEGGEAGGKKPMLAAPPTTFDKVAVAFFSTFPFVLLVAAFPLAAQWGWAPSALDWVMLGVLYFATCAGIGTGFHRHFTHNAFKANKPLRIVLAIFGLLALQGLVVQWVADHRRHHENADEKFDPHSPWRYGTKWWQVGRGLFYAHFLWLFEREPSNCERYAPDLMKDSTIRRLDQFFPLFVVGSLVGPGVIGGLATWSWHGLLSGMLWAGFVRVGLLHQVTWSINSICHVFGKQTFQTRGNDRATNFWPLAILSLGESWHNSHHADPTCARHGVDPGQLDGNARLIWIFEKFGWAWNVKWPNMERFDKKRVSAA